MSKFYHLIENKTITLKAKVKLFYKMYEENRF